MPQDPAETETAHRRSAGPQAFDRLVEATLGQAASNVELAKAVRTTLFVVAACAILSMTWCVFATYSMYGTLVEMRTMLQSVLDAVTKARS